MSGSSAQVHQGRRFRALPVWSFTLVIAGVTALAVLFAQSSQGADPRTAMSQLFDVTVDDVPELGVGGFTGIYGTAGTPDLSQANDEDTGDYSDPDGVQDHATSGGTELVYTSWDATSGQLIARANSTDFNMTWNGVGRFVQIGSLDAYAQCVKENAILAYSRSNTGIIVVGGVSFTEGTRTVNVTGTQLGLPAGVTGTATVEYDQFESVINTATEASAEAYVRLIVNVDLKNPDGTPLYTGRIIDLTLAHVKVSCQPRVMPSPSSSSVSPTASPTGSPSPTIAPNSITPTPTTESPSPSPSTESPSPTGNPSSGSPVPSPTDSSSSSGGTMPASPTPPDDDNDGGLAVTGSTAFLVMLGGVGVSMVGAALLALARHRRESRS